jgi:L-aspartate oxidase
LATGGGGQVFSRTTNPSLSTGDGVAIAWRAGAVLRDLEFIQFHPTALTKPNAPRFLISEAVRGEGAHLLDHQGRRFAFDYHPSGELAPRDVVSRAIFDYLKRNAPPDPDGLSHVWLDLRPIPDDTIRHRFPNIIQVCQTWGVDVFREPIPVAPAAHYWMGGIATDLLSQTTIRGIYAIGETANTGVHGANRLASNSLLECLVFGAQLAQLDRRPDGVDPDRARSKNTAIHSSSLQDALRDWSDQEESLRHWGQELPVLMWRSAGISREQQSLDRAIAHVEAWQTEFSHLPISRWFKALQPSPSVSLPLFKPDQQMRLWGETRNLLDIAALILKSAAFRKESRGGHYRSDFPQSDPSWQYHTSVQGENSWLSPTH